MSRQDLRAALGKLKVNEPFQLKNETPAFKKPVVEPTSDSFNQSLESPLVTPTNGRTNQCLKPPVVEATTGRFEGGGSFMIPHELFSYTQKITRSKNEMVVFNCLLRFTLGYRRVECEASLGFIAKWTGLGNVQNVAKALKRLQEKGLVEKVAAHDSRRLKGTVFRVPIVAEVLAAKEPLVKATSGRSNHSLDVPETTGSFDQSPLVDSTSKKEIINKNTNKPLPPPLADYFATLPLRKARSERAALNELLKTHSLDDIVKAFDWVKKHGEPATKAPVHSPLAFLTFGLGQVVKHFNRTKIPVESIGSSLPEICLMDFESRRANFYNQFRTAEEREREILNRIGNSDFFKSLPHSVKERLAILRNS